MSARALEFVETWISEKIEEMDELPADGDDAKATGLAAECVQAALDEGIPQSEISEAFDDLAAFIGGEIEEAKEREDESSDDDDGDDDDGDDDDDDEDEDDEKDDGEDDKKDDK
jgi:hypothetical protein